MPTKRLTRDEKKQQTHRQLLQAAAKLFERQGFAATSLEQVAEEAGVTKGAVYAHFRDKAELFLTFVDEHMVVMAPEWSRDATSALEDELRGFGRQAADAIPRAPRAIAFSLELRAFALRDPRTRRELARRMHAVFDDVVAPDRATPLVGGDRASTERPHHLAVIGQALVVGLGELRALDPELVPDEVFEEAFAMLARVAPEEPTSRRRTKATASR